MVGKLTAYRSGIWSYNSNTVFRLYCRSIIYEEPTQGIEYAWRYLFPLNQGSQNPIKHRDTLVIHRHHAEHFLLSALGNSSKLTRIIGPEKPHGLFAGFIEFLLPILKERLTTADPVTPGLLFAGKFQETFGYVRGLRHGSFLQFMFMSYCKYSSIKTFAQ
ncbi:hypothetical protein DN604_07225 [Aeromonas caviae]|nr:hypothetical protein DN604_07225 [Aeromonas caviae]